MARSGMATLVFAFVSLAAGDQKLSVQFEGGRLTTRIDNASMRAVLAEVATQTGVRITVSDRVTDFEVSADLDASPLDLSLRALLAECDVFFYYGGAKDDPTSLRAVWVFPKGDGATFQPGDGQSSVSQFESSLSDPRAEVRQKVYEALMSRPDTRSQEIVMDAIRGGRERDDELRQRILSAALVHGSVVQPQALADLARSDRSEQIRWMALDALAQHESAPQIAEAVLNDASAAVRQRAADILAERRAAVEAAPAVPEQQP